MDYRSIIDPVTMDKHDLHSSEGKEILNNYLITLQRRDGRRTVRGGGSVERLQGHAAPCDVAPSSADSPCFPDFNTNTYKNPCRALPLDSLSTASGGRRSRRNRRGIRRSRPRIRRTLSRKRRV